MYKIFKNLLADHGISAYKVSKETGIPQSTFTDWHKGRSKPKIEKLVILANFFNVDVGLFIKDRLDVKNKASQ